MTKTQICYSVKISYLKNNKASLNLKTYCSPIFGLNGRTRLGFFRVLSLKVAEQSFFRNGLDPILLINIWGMQKDTQNL